MGVVTGSSTCHINSLIISKIQNAQNRVLWFVATCLLSLLKLFIEIGLKLEELRAKLICPYMWLCMVIPSQLYGFEPISWKMSLYLNGTNLIWKVGLSYTLSVFISLINTCSNVDFIAKVHKNGHISVCIFAMKTSLKSTPTFFIFLWNFYKAYSCLSFWPHFFGTKFFRHYLGNFVFRG